MIFELLFLSVELIFNELGTVVTVETPPGNGELYVILLFVFAGGVELIGVLAFPFNDLEFVLVSVELVLDELDVLFNDLKFVLVGVELTLDVLFNELKFALYFF